MRIFRHILFLCIAIVIAFPSYGAPSNWWDRRWKCRRRAVAFGLARSYPGDDAAWAEFYTHGKLSADGADVRVVAGGQLVPHRIVSVGPGDVAQVLFKVIRGISTYHIYFGNPAAPKASYDWQPKRGLKLTTSRFAGGNFNNWQQAKLAFDRSGPVHGAGFVKWIFLGHNPFGPSGDCCARFEGWLDCPSRGEYVFATTSGNASFLFIDDQLVVSWPGWHGPVADARHQGRIWLEKGVHKIDYLGIHRRGRMAFVAGWRPPGQWMFRVIPQSAYVGISKAGVQDIEILGKELVPDFSAENQGEATLTGSADRYLVSIQFRNPLKVNPLIRYDWRWDFGDGTQAVEFAPTHVYLVPGIYPVKLTLRKGGRTFESVQRITVHRDWTRQTKVAIDKRETYYDRIASYDFARMPASHLVNAFDYFQEMEKPDDAIRVGRLLLTRKQSLDEVTYFDRVLGLGKLLLEKKDYLTVIGVYQQALRQLSSTARIAQLKLELADALLVRLGRLSEAEVLYQEVLAGAKLKNVLLRRRAYIGQGDVWRERGNYQQAEASYLQAERIPVGQHNRLQSLVMPAAYACSVEGYLKTGELKAAEEHLQRWLWQYPCARLDGHSSILRARLFIAQDEHRLAAAELDALVRVNPGSEYAAQALSMLADCQLVLGQPNRALAALRTLKTDYPESPLQEGLDERIARVTKRVKAKG